MSQYLSLLAEPQRERSPEFPFPDGAFIGVDEAGRGCLAGPVVAAAVLLPEVLPESLRGVDDSKKLTASKRHKLAQAIYQDVPYYGIGLAWPGEIDAINILNATFRAMSRACGALYLRGRKKERSAVSILPLAIDGNHCIAKAHWEAALPLHVLPQQLPCIDGDAWVPAISAASILAKTFRDDLMTQCATRFPVYGFAKHKGYGTKEHIAALREHGPCRLHRMTFQKVKPEVEQAVLL